MRLSIIGTGYVGLVAGACFADRGFEVITSTHDKDKVELINSGKAPFFEPELDKILSRAVKAGKLRAVLGREEAVLNSDSTFICVGTPSAPDGSVDLSLVYKTAEEIGDALKKKKGYHLVVVRSTVVPGTSKKVAEIISKSSGKSGKDVGICMSPEFLRQGNAVHDTLNPDRLVIGQHDKKSGEVLEAIYRKFYGEGKVTILKMNMASAEMVKYVSNAMLANKVSFINEIANICEGVSGVDVYEIARGVGLDRRIGPLFLDAGLGYGGSCFPKDVNALINFSKKLGYEPKMLETVVSVNHGQAAHAVDMARKALGDLHGRRIAILGLSFKPDTDDMREAASIRVIKRLLAEGASVAAYDPVATGNAKKILGDAVDYKQSAAGCLENADCCIIVTEWEEFRKLKPGDFAGMKEKVIIDGRRILDHAAFQKAGFTYLGIGLGSGSA